MEVDGRDVQVRRSADSGYSLLPAPVLVPQLAPWAQVPGWYSTLIPLQHGIHVVQLERLLSELLNEQTTFARDKDTI